MDIIPFIKRKHKIMVFLPKRGGRKLLFVTQVSNEEEIQQKVLEELEKIQEDVEIRQYKYIIALDTKTNTEVKIDNPFFDASTQQQQEKSKLPTKDEILSAMYLDTINEMSKAYSQIIPMLTNTMITSTTNTIKSVIDSLIEEKTRTSKISEISQLIMSFVQLSQNWDKVKKMIEDPSVRESIQKLMAGAKQ